MMIGPNVKTETLRDATSVVTLAIRSLQPAIRSLTPAMACSKSSWWCEILPNGNINGSRPRRFVAGSGFAERVVQSDVNVAAHDPSSLLCPHSPTAPGLRLDDYSTWRAVRFADPDEIG